MVQTDRQTPLSPLDYHYNVVEFSRTLIAALSRLREPIVAQYEYEKTLLRGLV